MHYPCLDDVTCNKICAAHVLYWCWGCGTRVLGTVVGMRRWVQQRRMDPSYATKLFGVQGRVLRAWGMCVPPVIPPVVADESHAVRSTRLLSDLLERGGSGIRVARQGIAVLSRLARDGTHRLLRS